MLEICGKDAYFVVYFHPAPFTRPSFPNFWGSGSETMSGCWWPSPTWNNWAYSARISCQVLYFFTVHLVNSRRLTCRYHALYRLSAPLRASTKEEDKMGFVAALQTRGTWDAIATVVNHSEAIPICHGPDITCQELERDASGDRDLLWLTDCLPNCL